MNTTYTDYNESEQLGLWATETETTSTGETNFCDSSNSNLIGTIGETYFEMECLRYGINYVKPQLINARVDRYIIKGDRAYGIHIKASRNLRGKNNAISFNNHKYVRAGQCWEPYGSDKAHYFACVWIVKGEECIWWLPYEKYKCTKVIGITDRLDCYKKIPKEFL